MSENSQKRIGKNQLQRVRDNPPEAPLGRRLSNKDRLKLSKAGTKNLLEGTMAENKKKRKKKKSPSRLELDRIGTNEEGDSIVSTRREQLEAAWEKHSE